MHSVPACSSSSESSSDQEGQASECLQSPAKQIKQASRVSSDPTLYDINPRLIRELQRPCKRYQAAVPCRMGKSDPPALGRLHQLMEEVVGKESYERFTSPVGPSKKLKDNIFVSRIMDMLDMKNKIMLQQSELPRAFNKITMSQQASRYQGAMEAAEAEMAGVFDEEEAEEAALRGVEKYKTGDSLEKHGTPKITVLGYIGCYDDKETTLCPKQDVKDPCDSD